MKPVEATNENIKKAGKIIREGGLVAFPTETVYGLGADALNPIAVAKIFEVKKRPSFNPLIIHIADKNSLGKYCLADNKKVEMLIEKFWPGALTLVLPKKDIVPEIVTADNPTVAIRFPSNSIALRLIEFSGRPIAAPSANLFNRLSPTTASHVYNQLGNDVDMILDGGSTEVGVESTIVEIDNNNVYLLRHGGIPEEEISDILNTELLFKEDSFKPNSPGQLPFHYSPTTPLKFIDEQTLKENSGLKLGALLYYQKSYDFKFAAVEYLSKNNDLREAAANLFSSLHKLEKMDLDLIVVEKINEEGLGSAIMDRLKKAAAKYR